MVTSILPVSGIPQRADDQRVWGNIPKGAEAFVAHRLLEQLEAQQQFCLWVTKDTQQAIAAEHALRFFASKSGKSNETLDNLIVLPDWETLPYDTFSPHEDIVSQRLSTLNKLPSMDTGILVIPMSTLLQRLAPKRFLQANAISLVVGQQLSPQQYRRELDELGYRSVETVYQHGEYALRGAIFDIFPMGYHSPVRIELFDTEIDSLRTFDPETQRSKEKIKQINMLPAFEFPWDDASRLAFRNRWLDAFPNATVDSLILRDIKKGIKPHGIEYYAPLFFEEMATLFDYLPTHTLALLPEGADTVVEQVWHEISQRYEDRRHDIQRPILGPDKLFLRINECFSALKNYPKISFSHDPVEEQAGKANLSLSPLPDVSIDDRAERPLAKLSGAVESFKGRTLIIAESAGRREALQDLFKDQGFHFHPCKGWQDFASTDNSPCLAVGGLASGFVGPDAGVQLITESEIFGQRVLQQRRRKKGSEERAEAVVKNLTELRVGAPVVHLDHGIGRYRGLETISIDAQTDEFLTLEYAGNAKLYVPVASLHLISRYSGSDESLAPLHRLGTEKWSSAKQKAMEKIHDTAAELLEVYAKREARTGFAHTPPGSAYRAFCADFPFEETLDQQVAINAVIQDMTKPQPMDRLVCGDVGFGKTEVAMRAAFLATYSGKQVAVLVPTTLLAKQHFDSFQDRFAGTAVKVEVLSRFKSGKEQTATLKRISEGKVDIIIGTHKLIQQDVKFKDLGLLIIDEEHRFGVQQKERLKAYRADVDILTLTATPIPRTLNMAMGNIRDLSIIATPPAKRLSVKTFIRERENALIREAALREILRGGQVYYLFNEVKEIEKEAAFLRDLLPEARVGVAHGQMRERELELAMSDFYHQRFNVLVCSTIIETGIDIPNANTIIIDRADKFGLAQLHQLRGRVGRSHHQAYAYLLTPEEKRLSKDAEKRLEAISASQELGAGFMLATHDLEIRGAGELLGQEQSGQIQSIGFSLYMELLEQAVNSLKEGKELSLEDNHHGTEINLRIPAIIPEDYLRDVHERLILYKRIANAKHPDELKDLQVEMIDRFGLLPQAVKNLFRQTRLKLLAQDIGITKLDAGETSGKIEFSSDTKADPLTLVQMVQKQPNVYRLEGATKLKFELSASDVESKLVEVEALLAKLINKQQD